MKASDMIHYLVVVLLPAGIVFGIFFWLKNLLEDLGAKITGIWVNSDQSFRVLIYDINSSFRGDVVWANAENQRILGKSILQNLKLRFFLFGKGCYICPFSHKEYNFRMRRLSKDSIQLYLTNQEGKVVENDTWSLVR